MMILETIMTIKLVKNLNQLPLYTIISLSWTSHLGQNGRNKILKPFIRYLHISYYMFVIIISLNTIILVILYLLDFGNGDRFVIFNKITIHFLNHRL
jgi:hypothetical protein